ncbi:hypothetical protein Pelo_13942 [Pelomyxa schiedti]|nr:hypothetical protein Pelo_13942 [Pelomyxa schiedti]
MCVCGSAPFHQSFSAFTLYEHGSVGIGALLTFSSSASHCWWWTGLARTAWSPWYPLLMPLRGITCAALLRFSSSAFFFSRICVTPPFFLFRFLRHPSKADLNCRCSSNLPADEMMMVFHFRQKKKNICFQKVHGAEGLEQGPPTVQGETRKRRNKKPYQWLAELLKVKRAPMPTLPCSYSVNAEKDLEGSYIFGGTQEEEYWWNGADPHTHILLTSATPPGFQM